MLFLAGLILVDQPLWLYAQVQLVRNRDVEPGLVIIVEGIGGVDFVGKSAEYSLKKVGLPHEIHHFTWTHGTGKLLKDLQDTQHILKKADELAAFIKAYRDKHPHRPIYIIGKSGGTGIVLYALQALPAQSVDRVILLSAAVSPTFDLRAALRATRQEIVSFHSRNDRMVLGLGTSKFGTIDRYYGNSAGMVGFTIPEQLMQDERQLYMRLVQVPYSTRMLREGTSNGSHLATSLPWFVAGEVAPWLR
jgi:pimeloyl-ACP methyl ester carboxylesterase